MKKTLLLLLSLCGWIVSAASSTPPQTIIDALDISAADQLVMTGFTTTTYQFVYGQTPEGLFDWSAREDIIPAPWPVYDGQNAAYGSGHLAFNRANGETSGTIPFLTPISFVDGQPVYDGTCLMTPEYNFTDNAEYLTAYSLSFQIRGAGTLSFLAKLSLDPENLVDFNTLLPPDHLVHLFDSHTARMIVLLDGEEIIPILESESGYVETGFEWNNLIDEETNKRPIEIGADWGLYSLEMGADRYNHKVEILVLLPGINLWPEPKKNLTTAAGVRAVYGSPTDNTEQDTDFSPCFYRVWFDDFRWLSYEDEHLTSLALVTITPDAASDGGVFQNINGESHYTYTFPQASNRIFLSSDYDNIVFMYTLDGSEPTVDSNGNRNDSTFLYDDVLWDTDDGTRTRYILRANDEAGIDISAPSILKVKAYEKIGEATYIPTDGLTYPKKNLAGFATVYHYVPRVPTPEMQLLPAPPTPLRPGGTLRITSTAPSPVTFYYTLDGSMPTWQSNGLPSGTTARVEAIEQVLEQGNIQQADLPVTAAGTVRCIAVKAGWSNSEPASLTLEQATAPVIDLAQGRIYCQDGENIFTQAEYGDRQQWSSGDALPVFPGYFLCQTTAPDKLNSECVTVMNFPALQQGWNLLVLPGQPGQLQIPPNTIAACFAYDAASKTYTRCTQFVPGQPCWVFALQDTVSFPLVLSAPLEQLTLTDKWNFAGGLRNASLPAGVFAWGWKDNRFQFSHSMSPWEGFWLFPPQTITITSDYVFE